MEKRKKKEKKLRQQLQAKEAERADMEDRYASLQEEAIGKTKKLKEVWKQFQQTKEEVIYPLRTLCGLPITQLIFNNVL